MLAGLAVASAHADSTGRGRLLGAARDSVVVQTSRDPAAALSGAEARLQADSTDYGAAWVAALALIDEGRALGDSGTNPVRDSLYARAVVAARRAVRLDPEGADGHFLLANVLGRTTRSRPKKEQLRLAAEILAEATRAVAIDSLHHGAYHVLGEWHFEMMKVSGINKFFARTFLGTKVFETANWPAATANLERAVAIAPWHIYHRLQLAIVLAHRGRYSAAREQLQVISTLPARDALDPRFQREAAALLATLADRKDKS